MKSEDTGVEDFHNRTGVEWTAEELRCRDEQAAWPEKRKPILSDYFSSMDQSVKKCHLAVRSFNP